MPATPRRGEGGGVSLRTCSHPAAGPHTVPSHKPSPIQPGPPSHGPFEWRLRPHRPRGRHGFFVVMRVMGSDARRTRRRPASGSESIHRRFLPAGSPFHHAACCASPIRRRNRRSIPAAQLFSTQARTFPPAPARLCAAPTRHSENATPLPPGFDAYFLFEGSGAATTCTASTCTMPLAPAVRTTT